MVGPGLGNLCPHQLCERCNWRWPGQARRNWRRVQYLNGKDRWYRAVTELLGEHPPERAAGEQVNVEVRHFLTAVLAHVG